MKFNKLGNTGLNVRLAIWENLIGTSYLKRTPKTLTVAGDISASGDFLAKSTSTGSIGSIILTNLPKTDPLVTGSLWVSSSSVNADNKPAGYVMVSGIHG